MMTWLAALKYYTVLIACIICFSASATDIHVNVEVLGPSCTVNNGEMIEVDLGDELLSTKLDYLHYLTPFILNFECNAATPKKIYIKIIGDEWVKNTWVLKTSKEGLAIAFSNDSGAVPIKTKIAINPKQPYLINANPVSTDTTILKAGPFTAVATLEIYYE